MPRVGGRSLWGAIQYIRELAPGAWQVETAGHGGIKLDRKRNAAVPWAARALGGWYEEDCQWAIAAYVHEDVRDAMLKSAREADPEKYNGTAYVVRTIAYWETAAVCEALGISKPGVDTQRVTV